MGKSSVVSSKKCALAAAAMATHRYPRVRFRISRAQWLVRGVCPVCRASRGLMWGAMEGQPRQGSQGRGQPMRGKPGESKMPPKP